MKEQWRKGRNRGRLGQH